MATLIGKVGMVMKGDYNSANTYEALDAVSYNNGLYVAKQNVPANTAPTNTTYWQPAVAPSALNNNFVPKTKVTIASNTPTVEELAQLNTNIRGSQVFDFNATGVPYITSSLYYTAIDATYGAGLLISFYGRVLAYVVNAGNTWSITNITVP